MANDELGMKDYPFVLGAQRAVESGHSAFLIPNSSFLYRILKRILFDIKADRDIKRLSRKLKGLLFKKPQYILEINITYKCNLICPYCSRFLHLDRKVHDIGLDYLRKIAKFCRLYEFERVYLSGGEPLIHPDFHELAFYGKRLFRTATYGLKTNGMLHERISDKVLDRFDEISLSWYPGINDAVFNRLKNRGIKTVISCAEEEAGSFCRTDRIAKDECTPEEIDEFFSICPFRKYKLVIQDRIYPCCIGGPINRTRYTDQDFSIQITDAPTRWIEILEAMPYRKLCDYCWAPAHDKLPKFVRNKPRVLRVKDRIER
jgi:hypothetical protein